MKQQPSILALMLAVWGVFSVLALSSVSTQAADLTFSGLLDGRIEAHGFSPTDLEPDRTIRDRPPHQSQGVGVIEAFAQGEETTLSAQFRARGIDRSNQDNSTEKFTDELYLTHNFSLELSGFAGRRNLVFGQTLSFNPLDVFYDPFSVDPSLDSNRWRKETPGQDLLGVDILAGSSLTLTGWVAPTTDHFNRHAPHRAALVGEWLLSDINADATMMIFKDDRPGAGGGIRMGLGDNWVLYGEGTVRQGRDRQTLISGANGDFTEEPLDETGLYPHLVAGANYSFGDGGNLFFEYIHNQNGYSDSEWQEIVSSIEQNSAIYREGGLFAPLGEGRLLLIHALLGANAARQNYLYLNYEKRNLRNITGLDFSFESLVDIEDAGFRPSARTTYDVNDQVEASFMVYGAFGHDDSEYGLVAEDRVALLSLTFRP